MKKLFLFFILIIGVISEHQRRLSMKDLPKEFRQWHLRIVGEGYFQYLIPRDLPEPVPLVADGSYHAGYATGDLPVTPNDDIRHGIHRDPFELGLKEVTTSASCTSSIGAAPPVAPDALEAGACLHIAANCTSTDGVDVTVVETSTDATTAGCIDVSATCVEKVGTDRSSALLAASSSAPAGQIGTLQLEPGLCIETHVVTLNNGFTSAPFPVPGDKLIQNLGTGGEFEGTIVTANSDYTIYSVNDVKGTAGTGGTTPVEFSTNNLHKMSLKRATDDSILATTLYPTATEVRVRTFTPARIRTFSSYIERTFTPAVLTPRDDQLVYSRYGNLHINKNRLLADPNGLLLVGETAEGNRGFIHIPEFFDSVHIGHDGKVNIKFLSGQTQYLGRIQLIKFSAGYGLNLYSNGGFEVSCTGANALGFSLGSWCRGSELDGMKLWYYIESMTSGTPKLTYPTPWGEHRIQQYHLNSADEDLFIGGKKPNELYTDEK